MFKLYLAMKTKEVSDLAQWGGWGRRLVLIYNPYFKPRPRILKLTSFIYFALTEHTTAAALPSPTSLM